MGSRGAFIDLESFDFVDGGQHFHKIGELSTNHNVIIVYQDSDRVKAPEYSHTPGRIYAVVKNGTLKHLAYYDMKHLQAVCIDFCHDHRGVQPHRHVYLNHSKKEPGVPPTPEEIQLSNEIKKEFNLK